MNGTIKFEGSNDGVTWTEVTPETSGTMRHEREKADTVVPMVAAVGDKWQRVTDGEVLTLVRKCEYGEGAWWMSGGFWIDKAGLERRFRLISRAAPAPQPVPVAPWPGMCIRCACGSMLPCHPECPNAGVYAEPPPEVHGPAVVPTVAHAGHRTFQAGCAECTAKAPVEALKGPHGTLVCPCGGNDYSGVNHDAGCAFRCPANRRSLREQGPSAVASAEFVKPEPWVPSVSEEDCLCLDVRERGWRS